MLHGICAGEEAGARNRAFFRVKWLHAAGDEGQLVCAAGAAGIVLTFFFCRAVTVFKLLWMRLCVRRYRVFWNLWLQIAVDACFVAMRVNTCGFATSCCKTHCNGCMNVAWYIYNIYIYVCVCAGEEAGA